MRNLDDETVLFICMVAMALLNIFQLAYIQGGCK